MGTQAEKARAFRALHHGRHVVLLPNAWDVASARVFENAGFAAVATSSAGLMISMGYPDGERMPRTELAAAVGRIARKLSVPVNADIVAGFGATPRAVAGTVRKILAAGAVGINIEDADPSGRGLFPVDRQVETLRAIRRLGESMGVPVVVTARTDALRHTSGGAAARLRAAIARSIAYRDAGADCVYPMGLTDPASLGTFVRELGCPVNVMIRNGLPPIAELERLGIRRVSFGPAASYAAMGLLRRASDEILARGRYDLLLDGAFTDEELNELAEPKSRGEGRRR
ncbi:MAG: isocitrate lyase/PEP mutase family protein [Thermoplasmata archaeon]